VSESHFIESDSADFRNLQRGICPDCHAELIPGPRGGAAQNFYCTEREACRRGFNLTLWQGKLVIAHRIGEVPDQVFARYAERSQ
jgi:hypothetical protein